MATGCVVVVGVVGVVGVISTVGVITSSSKATGSPEDKDWPGAASAADVSKIPNPSSPKRTEKMARFIAQLLSFEK
jgi:hypothetical protein